ncbi:MAG TPA: ABC transporter substrate-binding protein [Candidatus Cybelea sp.]|nr:ABC transporter substrate-binding protein [Candidatus Cybelea sp.]
MRVTRREWGGIVLGAMISIAAGKPAAADTTQPVDVIKNLYSVLLDVMQHGPELGFEGRYQKLEPAINQAFDVATMCKIAIGPSWTSMPTDKKNALLVAFDKFLVSTYAARFRSFSGQQLEVGEAKPAPDDRVLVETKLVKSDGQPVELNYLFRKNQDTWQVIDIYLAGSISQMSQMRSEFSEPLQKGGVDVLIQKLDEKTKQLQAAA